MKQTFRASLTGTKPPFASSMQQFGKNNPKNKIQKPQSQSSNLVSKIDRATTTKTTTEKKIKIEEEKKIRNKVLTFLSHKLFFFFLS